MQTQALRLTAATAASTMMGLAWAGQCCAGKLATNDRLGAATEPVGIVVTELASIGLERENVKLDQRRLRLRHVTIISDGIVRPHEREERRGLIMVNAGEISQYSIKCAEPTLHTAREVAPEFMGTEHW